MGVQESMEAAVVVAADGAKPMSAVSRRSLMRSAAWATPVMATAVVTPFAAATGGGTTPLGTDIVLSFAGGTTGSTQDISAYVIAWIKQQLLDLGPQVPPAPQEPTEPVVPDNDPLPKRNDYTGPLGEVRYQAAVAAWQLRNPGLWKEILAWRIAQAEWAAEYAQWLYENRELIAQRAAWEIAIAQLERMMNELAAIGEMLFSASISYPQQLVVTNNGPEILVPGDVVTVTTTVDSSLINAHLPNTGEVSLIQTGGTTTMSHIVTDTVPVGGVVFTQPLAYNPASVTLNIQGSTTNSSVTSVLDTPDSSANGNTATAPIGITLNVMTGDLQEVLDRWEQLTSQVDDLRAIWDLISPYIDWSDIISGILPLPQLS